jgi:hypothetical protein
MTLQKTVIIQEGYGEEPSAHYEAPRDKEKLLKVPRPGMYSATHVIMCPEMSALLSLQNFCRILFDLDVGSLK